MDRRTFLVRTAATAVALSTPLSAAKLGPMKTRWVIRGSEGFDALSFLSPLSGDPFYLKYYEKEVAEFAPRMPGEAMATLKAMKQRAEKANVMLSPFLDLRFSAGPDATIEDLLASAADPEARILPGLRASPYWEESETEGWPQFKEALPGVITVLQGLKTAGFPEFRRAIVDPKTPRMDALKEKLAGFDPISGAEFYTGRKFDPTIEIILLQFSNPHGIKVIGQRFLSGIDYPDEIHIRTAGHEILHPPVDKNGPAFKAALQLLGSDALLSRVVKEHDPKFGYTDLDGLIDEDLVEALDQLIAEQSGIAKDPRERWSKHDDGMHVLAAAFYGMMKQDGYAATGGNLEQWLLGKVRTGALSPKPLHAVASSVLGYPADQLWPPPKAAS